MSFPQVATPATEATPGTQQQPGQAVPAVNAPAATPSTPATTTPPAPAVPGAPSTQTPSANTPAPAPQQPPAGQKVLTQADLDAALRKQQAAYDRQQAQLHKQYQQQLQQQQQQLMQRLQRDYQLDPAELEGYVTDADIQRKAQQYDAIQQQAQQWQQWYDYVASVATTHGLQASDPRLANAVDANDLITKAREALRQDAEAERQRILGTNQQAAASSLHTQIAAGEHDTLDGAPSTSGGIDLTKYGPEDSSELYRIAAQQIQQGNKQNRRKALGER